MKLVTLILALSFKCVSKCNCYRDLLEELNEKYLIDQSWKLMSLKLGTQRAEMGLTLHG